MLFAASTVVTCSVSPTDVLLLREVAISRGAHCEIGQIQSGICWLGEVRLGCCHRTLHIPLRFCCIIRTSGFSAGRAHEAAATTCYHLRAMDGPVRLSFAEAGEIVAGRLRAAAWASTRGLLSVRTTPVNFEAPPCNRSHQKVSPHSLFGAEKQRQFRSSNRRADASCCLAWDRCDLR